MSFRRTMSMGFDQARMVGERFLDFVPFAVPLRRVVERTRNPGYLAEIQEVLVPRRIGHWRYLLRNSTISLRGAHVVEIGTGWTGIDLVLLYLLGVDSNVTIDRFPHLGHARLVSVVEGCRMHAKTIESELGVVGCDERLSEVRTSSLSHLLSDLHVSYITGDELSRTRLPSSSIDLLYTYSSLHCLPIDELERTLAETARIVKPGRWLFNDIRFIDNYYHGQSHLNPFGYLRHSDWLFKLKQSKTFNTQNRLRHSEFLSLFRTYGFELVTERFLTGDVNLLRAVPLAERFRGSSQDDLLIVNATMIHRLGDGQAP